jgi:glycosyltransferase involved in cell wall biosynthesis
MVTALDPETSPEPSTTLEAEASLSPARPFVSVIVRTCNRRRSLEECLQSLKAQTWQDFEVILINDGGEDVADLVAEVSPPLRVTYRAWRPSRGRPQALNAGLKEAKGEFLSYLDDDDIYYPDHLETLVTALRSSNYLVAYTDIVWAFQRLTPEGGYETYERRQLHAREFDPDWLLFENYIPSNAIMHARACLEAVGSFDETFEVLEDWELWIRLAQRFDFRHIGKCTAEYRKRDDSSNITDAPWKRELFATGTARLFGKYARERERAAQRLFEQVKQGLSQREERIAGLEAALTAQSASEDQERQRADALKLEREVAGQALHALTSELEQERQRVRAIEHDLEQERQRVRAIEHNLEQGCQRAEALERERDLANRKAQALEQEIDVLRAERETLRSQLARIQNTLLYRLLWRGP